MGTAESDNKAQSPPKTPAPKAPKTPKKTPKAQKPLPEGFIVVEKLRSKDFKVDKEYYGPDGKKYRSVAEIYKKLNIDQESGPGESSSQESLEIKEEVVTNWNIGEEEAMSSTPLEGSNENQASVTISGIGDIEKKKKKKKK